MNTTKIGDKFRDQVGDLLRAAGYTATTEILEGHKRVDVLFEHTSFGKRRRYALEAKNWAQPLNQGDLETIYGGYASLVTTRKIDELLIVSPHELRSPTAKTFIRETPGISHMSFKEFQESIMGFREYLSTYAYNHDADGLENYFISPILDTGEFLEAHIDSWTQSHDAGPIAIIASYGMGKTSFARHYSYKLATRFLAGEACRVPILVSLGTISREQSLEGLIGSVLAGTKPSVTNYNFPLFFHLNSIGRFLVLLDGFDEMKHMMSLSEFQSNFDELNRLVTGRAKVLLLGRPTVFLSENERFYALRGTQSIGKATLRTPGSPSYSELTLSPFSPNQITQFIHKYITHHREKGNIDVTDDLLSRRQKELEDKAQEDLLARPIHTRMLADIATDPKVDISGISRFALYDHFIDHLIKREMKKTGRGSLYKAGDRRSFACDLAWYLWTSVGSSGIGCRLDELPDQLFAPYLPPGEDLLAVKRDLLSGSFLDEKSGGVYFFSHRSFQEFLVAEHIWNNASMPEALRNEPYSIDAYLTQEVFDFIIERDDKKFFGEFLVSLNKLGISPPLEFYRILASSEVLKGLVVARSREFFSRLDATVLVVGALDVPDPPTQEALRRLCRRLIDRAEKKPAVLLSSIVLLLDIAVDRKWELTTFAPYLVSLLFARAELDLSGLAIETNIYSPAGQIREIIFGCVSGEYDQDRNLFMRIDLSQLYDEIASSVDLRVASTGLEPGADKTYRMPFVEFFAQVPTAVHGTIRKFYEKDAKAAESIDREDE